MAKIVDDADKRKMFSCKLPPDLISAVRTQAKAEGRPITDIAESALRIYLKDHPLTSDAEQLVERQAQERREMREKLQQSWNAEN